MSAKALHLNLLNAQECASTAPVRIKVILPLIAGIATGFMLIWAGIVGVQFLLIQRQVDGVRGEISEYSRQMSENDALTAKFRNLMAEYNQFGFYCQGRNLQGELLEQLAYAVPEDITLTTLSIPPPPDQELERPPALKLPPLPGPTQTVEQVELRLAGIAQSERDVFLLMEAMKGNAFTGLVRIVEHPSAGVRESPRVLAFREEAAEEAVKAADGHRNVIFDLVYDLAPREFVK